MANASPSSGVTPLLRHAVFADYLWLASYSVRFGGPHRGSHHDMQKDSSAVPGTAKTAGAMN
jgi:hypothetical protein